MADSAAPGAEHIANAASPLLNLPLEILLRITYFLNTEDLGKVRLCCKLSEELLLVSFTREYFSRRQFALLEPSVKAFVDISKSRFRQHLSAVHIAIDIFSGIVQKSHWNDSQEGPRARDLTAMDTLLWSSGQLTELLAEGFRNLPNLKAVVVRWQDSNKRERDFPNTRWRSWGVKTLTGSFEHHHLHLARDGNSATKVFQVVLIALAKANISLDYLEVMAPMIHEEAYIVSPYMAPQIKNVLQNVSRLHLWIGTEQRPIRVFSPDQRTVIPSAYMCDFLSYAPNVTDLRLNAGRGVTKAIMLGIMERIVAEIPAAASLDSKVDSDNTKSHWVVLPKLQILSLGHMTISMRSLLSFLQRCAKSLKDISLWTMELELDDEDAGLQNADDNEGKPLWCYFLQQLRGTDMELERLSIGRLRERKPASPQKNVHFRHEAKKVTYQGPVWKSFIGDILPHIHLVETRPVQLYPGKPLIVAIR